MKNIPETNSIRDHSKEVEARVTAIRVSPRDCCMFFQSRTPALGEMRECWYCAWSAFSDNKNLHAQGLCKFKQ